MADLVGTQLGKYKIVAKLGQGGMAEVYKAFQPGLKRYVAIKVMHSHLVSEEGFVSRFQREALATGKLRHQNIVQAMDFDQADGTYFLVMEFVDGPSLKHELQERHKQKQPFSLAEVGRIFTALCEAIDVAHHQNMVHRDLKPANVLLTQQGQVLLTDFGIARLMDGTQYTATGSVAGTPAYMSPEQGQGQRGDQRSDIYSLGVMLYEMLTGRIPYDADTPYAIVIKHITNELPLPSKLNPQLPQAVERVVLKALAKSPNDRYQKASDLAADLRQAIGLTPGDTLSRAPLQVLAIPPKVRELDPVSNRFITDKPQNQTPTPTLRSATNQGATISTTPLPRPMPAQPASNSNKPLIAIGVVIILLMLFMGVLITFILSRNSDDNLSAAPMITETSRAQSQAAQTVEAQTSQLDGAAKATATWRGQDDDRDGLTNGQEQEVGTLENKRDTDEDGVDDGEEINTYKTDPLKSDSDSDGLKDGQEVSKGLDPLSNDTDGDGLTDNKDPEPGLAPTLTPTPILPTDTPTVLATEEPTVTSTPMPSKSQEINTPIAPAAPIAQTGPGMFLDFETASNWRRGDQPYGEITNSNEQARSGKFVGKLSYDFPKVADNYVVLQQAHALPGQPKAIVAAVYGDKSGHYLNVWLKDAQSTVWQATFGQIKHSGWQTMTALLDMKKGWPNGKISGPDSPELKYPVSFSGLVLDGVPDNAASKGAIYLDDLTSLEQLPTAAPIISGTTALTDTASATEAEQPAPPPAPTKGRLIFPVDNGSGRYDLWAIQLPDGKPFTVLQGARQPNALKKDGRVLANGQDNPNGLINLILLDSNFSNPQHISDSPYDDRPFWDPDGTRFVYGNSQLISGFSGSSFLFVQCSLIRPQYEPNDKCKDNATYGVLTSGGGEIVALSPVWTRDGTHNIAFLGIGGNAKIGINRLGSWATKRDGGDKEQPVVIYPQARSIPTDAYSDRIYFFSDATKSNWEVYSMKTDGSGLVNLSNSEFSSDGLPTVSPDGQWVAFVSDRAGAWAVYVVPTRGGTAQKLFDFPKANPWATGERDWTNERISWGP